MKEEIIDRLLNHSNCSEEYEKSLISKLDNYIEYSQLPPIYQKEFLDPNDFETKLKNIYENIEQLISLRYSFVVQMNSYKESGFLTSTLMQKYFMDCVKSDTYLGSVLYIDTKLLMSDYKKLISNDNDSYGPKLVHNLETLYNGIENAEFVFWDKFTMIQGNYELSKIYDILSIRYRNCLGNLYFIDDNLENTGIISQELVNVMNMSAIVSFENRTYKHTSEVR